MAVAGRSISMFSLITEGILEPGEAVLTFDYLVLVFIVGMRVES